MTCRKDTITGRMCSSKFRSIACCTRRKGEEDWPWFEPVLSYANAKLPHALICSDRHGGMHCQRALALGVQTLRWLVAEQTRDGLFVPIGCRRGGQRARFDQQPIEAQATVSACNEAFEATGDHFWRDEARRAFEWFVGPQRPRPTTVQSVIRRLL